MTIQNELKKIKKVLKDRGWLMESDSALPSVVTLIVGKPVKGSWWGLPKGHLIYNTCRKLDDVKNILCLKLINGKRSYVHRQYWNLLFTLIEKNRDRALASISPEAIKILKKVEKKNTLRSDQVRDYSKIKPFVKELEKTLLCYSQSTHTESGFHITELVSWSFTFNTRDFRPQKLNLDDREIQLKEFTRGFETSIRFPWK